MFPKSTFSLPQASGFVAFDGGGATDIEAPRRTHVPADAPVTPRLEPELVRAEKALAAAPVEWLGSATWQPSTGAHVRRVEAAVIAAICGWFALGLAGVAGWL